MGRSFLEKRRVVEEEEAAMVLLLVLVSRVAVAQVGWWGRGKVLRNAAAAGRQLARHDRRQKRDSGTGR
jgi:hypothetical protein